MEKSRLIALAEKYLKGEATPQEEALLHSWYDNWQDSEEHVSLGEAMSKEDIRRKILSNLQPSLSDSRRPGYFKLMRYVAAASVLVLMTLVVLFFQKGNDKPVAKQQESRVQDLAPGGDRALLTLSDGTTIVLDSARTGTLAHQPGVNILKKDGGQIEYVRYGNINTETVYNTIRTPRGGQYRLVLPDGTRVWLNAETVLKYPAFFTGATRNVQLNGEAYFEVSGNYTEGGKQPFIVSTDNLDIKVLGTQFNVNAYADESHITTTLVEGNVLVYSPNDITHSLSLSPGQQTTWNVGTNILQRNDNPDVEQALAWKNGFFKFNSTDLQTIMRQVSRWYDVETVYEGDVQDETFSGDIPRAQYASEVFKLLELTKTLKFTTNDKKVTITSIKK